MTINEDETGLFELFTTMGKAGGCAASQSEALGRMVSLAWRNGIGEKQIIDQLRGISCHQLCGFGDAKVLSCADAVAKAVLSHMSAKTGSEEYAIKKEAQHTGACPDCGGVIAHESGCNLCHSCGWSACS